MLRVWCWVFVIALDAFGKEHRVASLSGLLMARARSRPTQTQPSAAATSRSRSLMFANCFRSRFVVATHNLRISNNIYFQKDPISTSNI